VPHEIALFWLVVAGFLLADNLVFVPAGCELLRFGRRGAFRYDASARLTAARREVVLLNPLNLFDRALITTRCFGDVEPRQWRQGRSLVRSALASLNGLSALGYFYMLITACLAAVSFHLPFTLVLLGFVVVHLLMWTLNTAALVALRHRLGLSGYDTFVLCVEAIFVPAYLMNMGKRAVHKKRIAISALGLGLRTLKRTDDEGERELLAIRLRERLQWLGMTQGHEVDDTCAAAPALSSTQQWISRAEACLTT